jgi:NADH-quinone oxidoreductase subunit J
VSAQDVVFALLAVATGLSALAVVTARNLVHAALFLAVTLGGTAGVFLVLHADFVAMVQLLVYVGAIAVLLMFGLMLTRAPIGREALDSQSRGLGLAVSTALFGVLAALIVQAYGDATVPLAGPATADIGTAIFSSWVLPFEIASMLLLAALVGAIVLARREAGESGPEATAERAAAGATRAEAPAGAAPVRAGEGRR